MRYDREQRLMLGYVHNLGEQRARDLLVSQSTQQKFGPTSWLAQQRRDVGIASTNGMLITYDLSSAARESALTVMTLTNAL